MTKNNIQMIREARESARESIQRVLQEFTDETDLSIVDIEIISIAAVGTETKTSIVQNVRLDL